MRRSHQRHQPIFGIAAMTGNQVQPEHGYAVTSGGMAGLDRRWVYRRRRWRYR